MLMTVFIIVTGMMIMKMTTAEEAMRTIRMEGDESGDIVGHSEMLPARVVRTLAVAMMCMISRQR